MFNQLATKLDKGIGLLTKIFSTVGSVFLVFMMLILVAEVVMRALGSGVLGSYEIVELAMVPLVFLSLGNVQSRKKTSPWI
jgi:TRAP-type C4-dicarboxylate transport system permease small subunit